MSNTVPPLERRTHMRPSEAAEALACSRNTINKWCHQGVFPGAIRVGPGRRWKIPREDVEAQIERLESTDADD